MPYVNYLGQTMPTTPWSQAMITGSMSAAAANTVLSGTACDDNFVPNAVDTMSGGAGNDSYQNVTMAKRVVEAAKGGIDTVYVTGDYVMADNVENLVMWSGRSAIGNTLGNLMLGSSAAESFNGAGGNDVLAGQGGHDVFRFDARSGYDVIADFATTGADSDIVRLAGYTQFTRFEQVRAALVQSGRDVILNLDAGNAVKFSNHLVADFSAGNFQLALDTRGMTLTFDEEFDTLSLWDGAKSGTWRTDYGYGPTRDSLDSRTLVGNGERQFYIDPGTKGTGAAPIGVTPFAIKDGVLTITAAPTPEALKPQLYDMDFVSGLLTTKQSFAQQYGYFEARIDVPEGSGLWPAFWFLSADGTWPPEIDVMEHYGTPQTFFTFHSSTGGHSSTGFADFDPAILSGFHTYGMLWTSETLSWYLDGVKIFDQPTPTDLNKPMYMLVDLAVTKEAPDDLTGELKIDYVRAYSLSEVPPAVQALVGTKQADVFTVTSAEDSIAERANGGRDLVYASVDYTLPANVEDLVLTGGAVTGIGNNLANSITGNARDNVLDGGSGADVLDGGGGADRMIGGAGADTYYVDHAGDAVVESGKGDDLVYASVDYSLPGLVENLILTGGAVRAVGNELANEITGNALDNWLTGGAGNDTLTGGAGRDHFVFARSSGKDVITDFDVNQDSIDWSAFGSKAPAVKASGAGTIVNFGGGDTITLLGVTPAELAAHHIFG